MAKVPSSAAAYTGEPVERAKIWIAWVKPQGRKNVSAPSVAARVSE